MSDGGGRRARRRVRRPSDAPDIDRSVDRPDPRFVGEEAADDVREVLLDPETEDSLTGEEFWREQRPPHY